MKYNLKKIIIICLLAFIVLIEKDAIAEDKSVLVSLYTKHFNYRKELNENNGLIGLKYNHLFAITFNNSNYQQTYFAGYYFSSKPKYLLGNNWYIKGNLYLGMSSGYNVNPNLLGWYPAIAPTAELGINNFSIEGLIWPTDGGVAVLLLNYKFK